jgi:hypothetical protein
VADTTRAGADPGEAAAGGNAARSDRLIASLVEFRKDALVVRRDGDAGPSTIPLDQVRRLEVSASRTSKAHAGAMIGLGAGLAGGILTGIVVCEDGGCEEAEGSNDYTGLVAAVFGIGGGLAGAGIGALTGSFFSLRELAGRAPSERAARPSKRAPGRAARGAHAPLLRARSAARFGRRSAQPYFAMTTRPTAVPSSASTR